MINIFYLVLSVIFILILLTNLTRVIGLDYSIITCFFVITFFAVFGWQIYLLTELFKHFNVAYKLENIFMIAFLVPTLLLDVIYFKYILIKTNIPTKEVKFIKSLEKFKLWKNKVCELHPPKSKIMEGASYL